MVVWKGGVFSLVLLLFTVKTSSFKKVPCLKPGGLWCSMALRCSLFITQTTGNACHGPRQCSELCVKNSISLSPLKA